MNSGTDSDKFPYGLLNKQTNMNFGDNIFLLYSLIVHLLLQTNKHFGDSSV